MGILGAGRIGRAIIKGFLNAGIPKENIIASTKTQSSADLLKKLNIKVVLDNKILAEFSDIIIVALKPFLIINELKKISNYLDDKIVISVAALVPLRSYYSLNKNAEFYRAMPNICVELNKGFIPLANKGGKNYGFVEELFNLLGETIWVDEEILNKLTLFSASTPALIAELIDSFYLAAMEIGIQQDIAKKAISSVFSGTAELAKIKEISEIRNSVITPKGTTIKLLLEAQRLNVKFSLEESLIKANLALEELLKKFK